MKGDREASNSFKLWSRMPMSMMLYLKLVADFSNLACGVGHIIFSGDIVIVDHCGRHHH